MSNLRMILHRHRTLRWLAPVGVLGAVAAAATAGGMITATANPEPLPATSPGALLADLKMPAVQGFSGTIVAQMSLGLPSIPGLTGASDDTSLTSLLAGSHTLRFWYGGPDQQRVALLGATDEVDVFHSGPTVWQWDSSSHTATKFTLPADKQHAAEHATVATLTPQQLSERALAAISPSTVVAMGENRDVADRSAYVLVLTPRDRTSRVGSVHITVDGATKVPLGVQVFARGAASPAIDVAFSDVTFKNPSPGNFSFTPPPGTHQQTESPAAPTDKLPSMIGSGWTSVVEYRTTQQRLAGLGKTALAALQPVSGTWGKGRLLESPLACALLTDDGRVFAGPVDPDVLYHAAATHK